MNNYIKPEIEKIMFTSEVIADEGDIVSTEVIRPGRG